MSKPKRKLYPPKYWLWTCIKETRTTAASEYVCYKKWDKLPRKEKLAIIMLPDKPKVEPPRWKKKTKKKKSK